jgi:hypothetical protein
MARNWRAGSTVASLSRPTPHTHQDLAAQMKEEHEWNLIPTSQTKDWPGAGRALIVCPPACRATPLEKPQRRGGGRICERKGPRRGRGGGHTAAPWRGCAGRPLPRSFRLRANARSLVARARAAWMRCLQQGQAPLVQGRSRPGKGEWDTVWCREGGAAEWLGASCQRHLYARASHELHQGASTGKCRPRQLSKGEGSVAARTHFK